MRWLFSFLIYLPLFLGGAASYSCIDATEYLGQELANSTSTVKKRVKIPTTQVLTFLF